MHIVASKPNTTATISALFLTTERRRWSREARTLARRASQLGDDGTNDLAVSEVLRTNELQVWFLSEHLVNVPLVQAGEPSAAAGAA